MNMFRSFFKPHVKRITPVALLSVYLEWNRQQWLNDDEQKLFRTILVLGPTGTGKSTLCNCLIDGDNYFKSSSSYRSQTQEIQQYSTEVMTNDKKQMILKVIDTPGLFDSERNNGEIIDEITQIVKNNQVDHIVLLLQYSLRAKPSDQMLLNSIKYCIPISNNNFSVIVNFVFPTQSFDFQNGETKQIKKNEDEDYITYIRNLFSDANVYQISINKSNQQLNEFKQIKNQLINLLVDSSLDNSNVKPWSGKMKELRDRDFMNMMNDYWKELESLKEEKIRIQESFDLKKKSINGTALGTVAVGLGYMFKYTLRGAFLISTPLALYANNYFNILEPEEKALEDISFKIKQKEANINEKLKSNTIESKYISEELQFFLSFSSFNKSLK